MSTEPAVRAVRSGVGSFAVDLVVGIGRRSAEPGRSQHEDDTASHQHSGDTEAVCGRIAARSRRDRIVGSWVRSEQRRSARHLSVVEWRERQPCRSE